MANAWDGVDGPHLPGSPVVHHPAGLIIIENKDGPSQWQGHGNDAGEGEQARRVKTVKVQMVPGAKGPLDQTVGSSTGFPGCTDST